MEKKLCHIYKITSPSGRIYIGKTTNLKERLKHYKYLKCKTQPIKTWF
jgi:predicted GIY-YIG superfamily endonuclease